MDRAPRRLLGEAVCTPRSRRGRACTQHCPGRGLLCPLGLVPNAARQDYHKICCLSPRASLNRRPQRTNPTSWWPSRARMPPIPNHKPNHPPPHPLPTTRRHLSPMFPGREFVPGQQGQQQQPPPQQQQQQDGSGGYRPPLPPGGADAAYQQPSVLRSAVNAPQFVPKGSGNTPPFRPATSPSPPLGLGNLKSTAAPFEPGAALNKLAVQAPVFVPGGGGGGGGGGSSGNLLRAASVDGLNTQALPFQPGGGGGGGGGEYGYEGEEDGLDGEGGGEGGQEYYGDEIFDWSVGASSLPAPPRKTLQRMGVPEQVRRSVQSTRPPTHPPTHPHPPKSTHPPQINLDPSTSIHHHPLTLPNNPPPPQKNSFVNSSSSKTWTSSGPSPPTTPATRKSPPGTTKPTPWTTPTNPGK